MHKVMIRTLYVMLVVFIASAALAMAGLASLWFGNKGAKDLPCLGWLLGLAITQAAGIVLMAAKGGVRYYPEIIIDKTVAERMIFMQNFIAQGSSVTIVGDRVSWLLKSKSLMDEIIRNAKSGKRIEIITPAHVQLKILWPLRDAGVIFTVTGEDIPPEARFTLINADRSGSEKLAIARDFHPEHEITIFDMRSGAHMISMARNIIRKSNDLARCRLDGTSQPVPKGMNRER